MVILDSKAEMIRYMQGELVHNSNGMCIGYWCEFCQTPHSSRSCYHPGSIQLSYLQEENKRLRELLKVAGIADNDQKIGNEVPVVDRIMGVR